MRDLSQRLKFVQQKPAKSTRELRSLVACSICTVYRLVVYTLLRIHSLFESDDEGPETNMQSVWNLQDWKMTDCANGLTLRCREMDYILLTASVSL